MDFFKPQVKHFGLKMAVIIIAGIVGIFLEMLLTARLGLNGDTWESLGEIAGGLVMLGLAIWWLHLPLLAKPQHVRLGILAVLTMLVVGCLDYGPLPTFSAHRLGRAVLFGLSAGIFEEVITRGLLLFLFYRHTPRHLSAFWWSGVMSALCFGAIHLTNLGSNQDLKQTLIQVLYATALGLGAAGIYLLTHNLGFTIFLHAFFDAFSYYFSPGGASAGSYIGDNWQDQLFLWVMVVVHLAVGIYLIWLVSREAKHSAIS